MRALVLVVLLGLPGAAFARETPIDEAAASVSFGDRLAEIDTPLDLKAAILFYQRALELSPEHPLVAEKIARTKRRLGELARPVRERADIAISQGDLIEAERLLCEAKAIVPFDTELSATLGRIRAELRWEADALQRELLQLPLSADSLGVPPGAERITNDPRFAQPARTKIPG